MEASSRALRAPVRSLRAAIRDQPVLLTLGAVAAVIAGIAAGRSSTAGIVLLVLPVGCLGWRVASRWSSLTLAFALGVMAGALLVPKGVEAIAEAVLFAWAAVRTLNAALNRRPYWVASAACLAVPLTWLILALNPNVPDLSTAILGVRKSTFVFVGVSVGLLWPRKSAVYAERFVIVLLVAGGFASLVLHLGLPSVEQGLQRASGLYTGLFADKPRLEGIYPGPFHVALLGTFLMLRAWHLSLTPDKRSLLLGLSLGVFGFALVALAEVRTAYVTLAVAILFTIVFAPQRLAGSRTRLILRALAIVAVGALFLVSGLGANSALNSLPTIANSTRATNRISSIDIGLRAFGYNPVFGNGPGSAGAADAQDFPLGFHVTADDEYLAVLVEGGLVGILVIGFACFAVARTVPGLTNPRSPSAAALYCLLVFCATTNAFEAIPVSVLLGVLVGLPLAMDHADPGAP